MKKYIEDENDEEYKKKMETDINEVIKEYEEESKYKKPYIQVKDEQLVDYRENYDEEEVEDNTNLKKNKFFKKEKREKKIKINNENGLDSKIVESLNSVKGPRLIIIGFFILIVLIMINMIISPIPNKEKTVKQGTSIISTKPETTNTSTNDKGFVKTRDDLSEFIKFLSKSNEISGAIVSLGNQENETIKKFMLNEVSREDTITFYKKSKMKKESLASFLYETKPNDNYKELYDVVDRRIRESINLSAKILQKFNNYQNNSEIINEINEYVSIEQTLALKQETILIELLKNNNIEYEVKDGEIYYNMNELLEKYK